MNEYQPSEYIDSASEYVPSEYIQSSASDYPLSQYIQSASEYQPSEYFESASEYQPSEYVPSESPSHYAPIQPASNYRHTITPIPEENEQAQQPSIPHNESHNNLATPSGPQYQQQHHVQPAQIHPNDTIKAGYRQRPPISAKTRQPSKLYNTEYGVPYLGVGAVPKRDEILFNKLWESETARIMRIIIVIYFWRANTITGKHQLPIEAVKQIHSAELLDYKIALSELYKRYLINRGHLTQKQADNYNFWNLEPAERRRWAQHLEKAGRCRDPVGKLWHLGEENGKEYLQLVHGPMCRSFVQSINAVHDIVAMWKSIFEGDTYIEYDLAKTSAFYHC